jgi:peptidyl-prolyl cis-trans isomerase A (cyclophilin A)
MLRNCLESCYLHDRVHNAVLSGKPLNVECDTSVGRFTVELHPSWAPWGVNRFLKLVEDGFFRGSFFHDTVEHEHVGFGIGVDESLLSKWSNFPPISDDSPHGRPIQGGGFKKGMLSFVTPSGERHGRTTELFIALSDDEARGQKSWETPIGVVTKGLAVLENMHFFGEGDVLRAELLPLPGSARKALVAQRFPDMAFITTCSARMPADELTKQQAAEEEEKEVKEEAEAMRTGSPAAAKAAAERRARRQRLRREEAVKKRTEERLNRQKRSELLAAQRPLPG